MVAKIGGKCICCGMCINECPYDAIAEAGSMWLDEKGNLQEPISTDYYFVIPWKCKNCGKCVKACQMQNIELV